MTDSEMWGQEPQAQVDLATLDKMVEDYRIARADYDTAKEAASKLYAVSEEKEKLLLDTLMAAGKSKYFVDGLGTVSVVNKYSFTTPKSPEEKEALFQYIRNKYGYETLIGYQSVNSQTLNSFAKKEMEEDATLQIPGLKEPTHSQEIRWTKVKV